jgi:hypothetical protein
MKMKIAVRWIAFFAICAAGALCEAKDLQWQEGKVTQIMEERNLALLGKYDKGVTYTIQAGDYIYVATETAGFVTSKFAPKRADENDIVKFALDGRSLTMLGKDGKQYQMLLRSSVKRQP